MIKQNNIESVVNHKVCCGCGACDVACPKSCISIIYGDRFNYAWVDSVNCSNCGICLKVCPSAFLLKGDNPGYSGEGISDEDEGWIIHAKDENVRREAASGGFTSALMLHMMEEGLCDGAVVARTSQNNPLESQSFLAMTREDVLSARGSRYAPVPACLGLKEVLASEGRYVFVGCPCHIEALEKLKSVHPILRERIVLTIGFMCAGTASRTSTRSYLLRYNVDISKIKKIKYRGNGWPGSFTAYGKDDDIIFRRPLLEYKEGRVIGDSLYHVVGQDHYLRCYNCLDHWGRFADITVSDPWSVDMLKSEKVGKSGILIRSVAGKQIVSEATAKGVFDRKSIPPKEHYNLQKALVQLSVSTHRSWMPLYQILFFGRFSYFFALFKSRPRGLMTTVRERLNLDYYNKPKRIST